MKLLKRLTTLAVTLAFSVASASATRLQEADSLVSSDHTKAWSFPVASDTFAGLAAVQNLTNTTISGQAPLVNLITTYDSTFENNSVNDWARYQNTAQSTPVSGTGGTPSANLTIAASNTTPIEGSYSLLMTKSGAANLQGYGFSLSTIPVPVYLRGQSVSINLYYTVASGTYTSGDLAVYAYDQTNSQLITGNISALPSTTTGVAGKMVVNFATSSSTANLRLIVHQATTTTNNYTLEFDKVAISEFQTVTNPVPANSVLSGSSGAFTTVSASYVDITNMSVSITTSGGPVMIQVVPDGNSTVGQESGIFINGTSNTAQALFQIKRDSSTIAQMSNEVSNSGLTDIYELQPVGGLNAYDTPPAGTYTYKIQMHKGSGAVTAVGLNYSKLLVWEMASVSSNVAQVSGWQSYTPTVTGFGTLGATDFKWRRVGDSIEVNARFISGTQQAAHGTITLPNGYTIDSSFLESSNRYMFGTFAVGTSPLQQIYSGGGSAGILTNNGTDPTTVAMSWRSQSSAFVLDDVNTFIGTAWLISMDFTFKAQGATATFANGSGNLGSVTKTAAYTMSDYDGIIYADTTSAWTLTIPAASSNNMNKVFKIKKTTSDFNVLTVSGGLSTTVNTIGEEIDIINDSSTWTIVSRSGLNALLSTTTPTILGSSVNPTPGTVTVNQASWYRSGSKLKCIYSFRQQGAGSNGSGSYMLTAVPPGSSLTVDTSKVTPGDENGDIMIGIVGSAYLRYSSNWFHAQSMYNTSNGVSGVAIVWDGAVGWTSTAGGLGSNANVDASASWEVPISGWNDY